MCQCPKRANLISTFAEADKAIVLQNGVNALNGLISFLLRRKILIFTLKRCVNALNGLISFLHPSLAVHHIEKWCVNALNGLISFLPIILVMAIVILRVSMP